MDANLIFKRSIIYIFSLIAVGLSGCATKEVGIHVRPGFDHASWASYSWLEKTQPRTGDMRADLPLFDESVRTAIEQNLTECGRIKVAPNQADVLIRYQVMVKTQEDMGMTSVYRDHGQSYMSKLGLPTVTGKKFFYEEGSLRIDFLDAKTHDLLWQGTTQKRLSNSVDLEGIRSNVKLAVDKILLNLFKKGE
jgi:hypothetical protein